MNMTLKEIIVVKFVRKSSLCHMYSFIPKKRNPGTMTSTGGTPGLRIQDPSASFHY